ncbi:SDK1-like protein, partial [Mya arenaria]
MYSLHHIKVPALPHDIYVPLGNITHDSFSVSFENYGNKRFTYWSVVVINSETGEWVAEDTRPFDVRELQISTNITSSTFYLVQVQTHVPLQSSDLYNTTFNTTDHPVFAGPRRPNSGVLVKANVTEMPSTPSLLEFPIEYVKEKSFKANITVPNTRFDNLSVKICEDLEQSTCFTKVVNNTYFNGNNSVTKLLSFENLSSATNYSVTATTGLTNDETSVTSVVYNMNTEPNPVKADEIDVGVVTYSTLSVVWNKPPAYTDGYELQWNCESPNIGTTPGIPESIENTDLTSRTSTIELQEPNKRNGILRRYDIWVLNNETETCEQLITYKCKDCDGSPPNASNLVPDTCNKSHSEMFSKTDATLSWNIQQLHPFRDYTANVVVYTTKPGSVSTIMFETREDVPGQPVELNASMTNDSLTLQWSPPIERNGIVLNYTIKVAYYEQVCGGFGPLQRHSYGVELDPVTKFTQNGLHAYWQYNLTVEATNAIATGKPSDLISVRTKETNPGSVQHLNYRDVFSKSVGVSWTKPCFANGILTGYLVTITKLLSEGQEESSYTKEYKIDVANESTSISPLFPYRNYKVEVYAWNSADPEKPIKVSTKNKTSSSLLIEWEKADHFNGPTKYKVHINDSVNGSIIIQSCTTSVGYWTDTLATECNVPGLDAYWEYDIVVEAITFEEGHDELIESSEKKTFRTAEAVPGPVAQFDVTPEENVLKERNFHIDWKMPAERELNGVLTGFIEVHVDPNTTSKTIQASTSVGYGAAVHKEITVNPGVDESKELLMQIASMSVDNNKKQITVILPLAQFLCNNSNGPSTKWGIVVAEADEAATDTAFAGSRDDFQKKIDDEYKNWFQVYGLNSESTNMTGALVGGAVSAVIELVIVLVIFFVRKRNAACFKKETENITHTSSDRFVGMRTMHTKEQTEAVYLQGPVKLTEFRAFVEEMHKYSDLLFADAYKEPSPKHPCTVAKSRNCRAKNRYTNSIP